MSFSIPLLGFALRQVLPDALAGPIAQAVMSRLTDHGGKLSQALIRAHDRAWQALGVALAGDGLLDRVKVWFASGDDKGVREQVQAFLQTNAASFPVATAEFRQVCLEELKRLRRSGTGDGMPDVVADEAATMKRFAAGPEMVEGANVAVARVADGLAGSYPNLTRLLRLPTPGGPPLLAAAFAFFFRREVEQDEELAHGLMFDGLRQLSAAQGKAFAEVGKALVTLGGRFDEVIGQLGRIEETTEATHGAVLDLAAELQRFGGLHLAGVEEVRTLLLQVQHHLAGAGMNKGEVRPQHSLSIRGEDERRAVKALLARFRDLPAEEQRQMPALLNGLGKLQLGAGDFAEAGRTFGEVASAVADPTGKAEASFNAYRAALEGHKYDEALEGLRHAARLDPTRFTPFPLHRYEPKRILGAGGFGTAILCHDRNFDEDVVVKALHAADLERGLDDVFREARTLRRLSHPTIIGVRDCEYADPVGKARPYLVMDYFAGVTLEDYVRDHGPLAVADLLTVARQIAHGMQAAHKGGILHRDLKPANVLLRNGEGIWQVRIIDFGLALRKQVVETSMAARAAGNTILSDSLAGTLQYAPPEQMGRMPGVKPGPYSDVYAFGKTCCYALFQTTEPKNRHWSKVPKELAEMLERCTDDELEHRHASFEAVLTVLEPHKQPAQEQTKERRPGDIMTIPLGTGIDMTFTWIPPGTFLVGSPESEPKRSDDEKQHRVTLTKGYWLGIYQVTQAQWQAVMGGNPSKLKGDNLPVDNVSWDDCQEFVQKLGQKTGKQFHLPTEAEWEYACRAGTTTPFHFGETIITDQANYNGNYTYGQGKKGTYRKKTTPVGSFPPNAWGLYDTHGNVCEWCQDWHGNYPSDDIKDPQGSDNGTARILRGGSYCDHPKDCRSACRGWEVPDGRNDLYGCRVLLCPD